jgi:hypothetical protein
MLAANQAVKLAPFDARSFRARAIANFSANNFEAMLEDASRTLELDPARHQAHLLRGHALKGLGRDSEAAKEYALEPGGVTLSETITVSPRPNARMSNCGIFVTELATPMNPNTNMIDDCIKRVMGNLESLAKEPSAKPTPKRKTPGLPVKKSPEK